MHPNERLDTDVNDRLDLDEQRLEPGRADRHDAEERVVDPPEGTAESEATPAMRPGAAPANGDDDRIVELLSRDDVATFRAGWQEIQTRFVDDPQEAVREADRLVSDVLDRLSTTFADRKRELEGHWQQDSAGETEDLRQALRRYRSFFDRLLNA